MASLVARAQADPGEDMLGMLVREHGDDVTTAELIGISGLLLLAGHETTSNMLGLGTLALLRHPSQLALIRENPDLVEPAIEELLRWLSIVHTPAPRVTTTEVQVAGHTIPAGSLVLPSIPAANRDPAVFTESAEAQELGRKLIIPPGPNNPVGLAWIGLDRPGYGIHGTPEPEKVGRTESHGCFRLANWDALTLLKLVKVGLPVWVEP